MTSFVPSVSLFAVLCAAPVWAQATPAPEPPTVVVNGTGIVKSAPDQAWVTIAAESRTKAPRDAQAQNAQAMTAVQQKLAAAGLPKDAIRTVSVSLQQEFDYANGKQTPRGYVARNVIEVRVDDLQKTGDVMDAAVGSGATSIQGLRFDVKERAALEREALTKAVADAMARAAAAASGARRVVDRVLKIEESGVREPAPPVMMYARAQAADMKVATPVAEGEIEIRAQVTVTAAIK